MRIRDAHLKDAAAIARVQVESWRTTCTGIVPADYLANLSYEGQARVWGDHLSHVGGATAL